MAFVTLNEWFVLNPFIPADCRVWKQCLPACCVLVALESTNSAEWGSSGAASKMRSLMFLMGTRWYSA